MTPEERFWAKVKKTDTCWLWTAYRSRGGYGQFRLNGKTVKAHRFAYELLIGPISEDLTLDHLCRVRSCVYPAHLEPVTRGENVLRGEGRSAIHFRQTHCLRGHPFEDQNIYRPPERPGWRECRECKRGRGKDYRARQANLPCVT